MKKIRGFIIGILCVGLIVGYYFYLSNRTPKTPEDTTVLTEVDHVILKDLDKDYPKTPREVIKFYDRILMCLYNETYTEEQFYELADQQRKLLDAELQEQNPAMTYYSDLQADINEFKERKRRIVSTDVCGTSEVEMKKVQGKECAYVTSSYFIGENNDFNRSAQEYVLRQDEEGNWKVVAFQIDEGDNSENEQ